MARLTEEMVVARSRQSDLSSIKKLNCWGSELSDVSIIRRMKGVEVLALSVNKINGLSDFENCVMLQELYLRKNNIQDLSELGYLQGLPHLKFLWLEENPCVENAGPNYRMIVLRALPNLKKLDNVDVTPEEMVEAMQLGTQNSSNASVKSDDAYEEAYTERGPPPAQQQQQQQQHHQQQQQQQPSPQQQQQHQPHPQQVHQAQQHQQQWRQQSPTREQMPVTTSTPLNNLQQHSPENTEESISEPLGDRNSIPSSPLQRTPPTQDYSPAEQIHPPSPSLRYQREQHRGSFHQNQYDRSPGSDQDSPVAGGYRERGPIVPSMSSHSMKEYYQSDYQKAAPPSHYRHSQSDLTDWEEHHQHNNHTHNNNSMNNNHHAGHPPQHRRSGPREEYAYRNGGREKDEWEDVERQRGGGGGGRRFNDTASTVSSAVLNHYASYHRRPVNRNSNLLSATLCLVKELDYPSLEVVEHAVRCRIDELSTE